MDEARELAAGRPPKDIVRWDAESGKWQYIKNTSAEDVEVKVYPFSIEKREGSVEFVLERESFASFALMQASFLRGLKS